MAKMRPTSVCSFEEKREVKYIGLKQRRQIDVVTILASLNRCVRWCTTTSYSATSASAWEHRNRIEFFTRSNDITKSIEYRTLMWYIMFNACLYGIITRIYTQPPKPMRTHCHRLECGHYKFLCSDKSSIGVQQRRMHVLVSATTHTRIIIIVPNIRCCRSAIATIQNVIGIFA